MANSALYLLLTVQYIGYENRLQVKPHYYWLIVIPFNASVLRMLGLKFSHTKLFTVQYLFLCIFTLTSTAKDGVWTKLDASALKPINRWLDYARPSETKSKPQTPFFNHKGPSTFVYSNI